MDNNGDDYLTNLSWLKLPKNSALRSKVECSINHIDDDLQCLCWLGKIRPTSSPSHLLKRLSITKKRTNHSRHSNRSSTHIYNPSDKIDDSPPTRRVLIVRTLNHHLTPKEQSFLFIHSSDGKISCFSINHLV